MMPRDEEYQTHQAFSELDRYIAFYETLGYSAFQFVTVGTKAICNIDSYVFSSMQGTLTSIRAILRDGRINDAYALLRKLNDSAVITVYSNLYLDENISIESRIVQQIDDWLQGKSQLPAYAKMIDFIRESNRVAPITQLLFADDRYKKLRKRCNDHMHYNFYEYVLLNDPEIYLQGRGEVLNDFARDVRDIVILHASYLFVAKQNYMASSDYLDSMECGLVPDPDSQYWVAPFVEELFDEVLVPFRPDLAATIKEFTSMQFDKK